MVGLAFITYVLFLCYKYENFLWPTKFGKCCLSDRGSLQRRSMDTVRADTQMLRVMGLPNASIPAKPGACS